MVDISINNSKEFDGNSRCLVCVDLWLSFFWSMLAPQTSVSKWTPKTVAVAVSQGKQGKDSLSELLNSQVFGRFNAENKVDQPKAVEVKDAPKRV